MKDWLFIGHVPIPSNLLVKKNKTNHITIKNQYDCHWFIQNLFLMLSGTSLFTFSQPWNTRTTVDNFFSAQRANLPCHWSESIIWQTDKSCYRLDYPSAKLAIDQLSWKLGINRKPHRCKQMEGINCVKS